MSYWGILTGLASPDGAVTPPVVTGFVAATDRREYSRFEQSRRVVAVAAVNPPSASVNFALQRGGVTVATALGEPRSDGTWRAAFDLSALADGDNYPVCISGLYRIAATSGDSTAYTDPFHVSLITVDNLKQSYCKGLPLYAREVLAPKRQPVVVTGVTIDRCSTGVTRSLHTLSHVYDGNSHRLKFDAGPEVDLSPNLLAEYLPDARGNYLEVTIDWRLLPTTDVTEAIIFDMEPVSDDVLRGEIERAASEMERLVGTYLEPHRVATEPFFSSPAEGEYFDARINPAVYYRQDMFPINAKVWHVSLPCTYLQKCYALEGWFGDAKTLDIAMGVFKCNVRQGVVEVLPQTTSYVMMVQVFAMLDYWGVREYIADFWRYKALVGLAETTPDLLKAIGYMAAIPVLTLAGQAYRGGLTSESISKDGVSRSTSVPKGMYSASIDEYKEWLKDNRERIVNRYKGINMVTL